jgi:protein phosphatase 1L
VQAFYGVYDGHGGRAAVDFVADKLGKNVVAALAASTTARQHQQQEPELSSSSSSKTSAAVEDEAEQEQVDAVVAAITAAYLTTDREFLTQVGIIYVSLTTRSITFMCSL